MITNMSEMYRKYFVYGKDKLPLDKCTAKALKHMETVLKLYKLKSTDNWKEDTIKWLHDIFGFKKVQYDDLVVYESNKLDVGVFMSGHMYYVLRSSKYSDYYKLSNKVVTIDTELELFIFLENYANMKFGLSLDNKK